MVPFSLVGTPLRMLAPTPSGTETFFPLRVFRTMAMVTSLLALIDPQWPLPPPSSSRCLEKVESLYVLSRAAIPFPLGGGPSVAAAAHP